MGAGLLGDKAHSAVFDNRKIKRLVPGFVATIPFHEGIRRTIAWFEADPSRWVVKPEVHAAMDRLLAAWEGGITAAGGVSRKRARPAGRGSAGPPTRQPSRWQRWGEIRSPGGSPRDPSNRSPSG